jgi:hypothetical protein
MGYQVLDHGVSSGGGIGFAVGQTATQISLPVALKERSAGILGRSYRSFFPSPMAFPNLPFDILNDFGVVDWHGCGLYTDS